MKCMIAMLFAAALVMQAAQDPPAPVWKFAVSGDSRNCGDVVMPAIAAAISKSGANFYWHLGDFRAIYDFDQDMVPPPELHLPAPRLTIAAYLDTAWADFLKNQIDPFRPLEVFLGIGNHELIYPKTRDDYRKTFESYLNSARLRLQRQQDGDKSASPQTYYHWVMNDSVDFISLDNANENAFDDAQMTWLKARLDADEKSSAIRTVVLGMHEALPGSKGLSHSMCDSPQGITSGSAVYQRLWRLQQGGKKVYVLASHSHFVMDDVFRTGYWGDHVLPGWIVGTAGAVRYRLPPNIPVATIAKTDVYGYLLATVLTDGSITFSFQELGLDDLRAANEARVPESLVRWCFFENSDQTIPKPTACRP
ncbi:MAG: hypothetical protein JWP08_3513 [Bryobacterales bacterium]|nr:hypothetical protein [Bryobacterales bacterium]